MDGVEEARLLKGVRHEFPRPLVPGRLVRRYKRFLADVRLEDGEVVTAHCPNSGSMLGCLADDAPVYLSPHDDPRRRTAYTWEMIQIGGGWVGINTLVPNRLVARAARLGLPPLFTGVREVRPEVKVSDHSRLDLLVQRQDGPLYLEVKNVTLVQQGQARFPDARTTRGARHLEELMRLAAQGAGAAMVYLVQRGDAGSFAPADDIDPHYAELYHQARRSGVEILVWQATVSPQGIHLSRRLPLAS